MALVERADGAASVEHRRRLRDVEVDEIGGILGDIGVGGEHRGNGIANIAHAVRGEDGLAIGGEALDPRQPEIDRRDVADIGEGPYGGDAGQGAGRGGVDPDQPAVRHRRAHHAHGELVREADIGGELAVPGHQRAIFEALDRAADEAHGDHAAFAAAARSAARMRWGVAGNSSIETPNGESASLTALTIAAGAPMVPPSPRPLALVTEAGVSVSR